jgi:hypothetical protein
MERSGTSGPAREPRESDSSARLAQVLDELADTRRRLIRSDPQKIADTVELKERVRRLRAEAANLRRESRKGRGCLGIAFGGFAGFAATFLTTWTLGLTTECHGGYDACFGYGIVMLLSSLVVGFVVWIVVAATIWASSIHPRTIMAVVGVLAGIWLGVVAVAAVFSG